MEILNYIVESNGDIILSKKQIYIDDINECKKHDFKKSIILECIINNVKSNKLKYKSILVQIYTLINDGVTIIKNSKMNIKTVKYEQEGFYYINNIGISVQGVDSNKCILEILNQCTINDISIKLKIKLLNNVMFNISIN